MTNPFSIIKTVKAILGPYWGRAKFLVMIIVLAAISEGLGLALILPILDHFVMGRATASWQTDAFAWINRFFPGDSSLIGMLSVFLFLILVKLSLLVYRTYLSAKFSQTLRRSWMHDIYERYLRAPYSFILENKTGSLVHNVIQEPQYAASMLNQTVDFLARGVLVTGLFMVLLLTSWRITLVVSLFFGIIILATYKAIQRYATRFGKIRLSLNQKMSGQVAESISGVRQIKAFLLENYLTDVFTSRLDRLIDVTVRFMVAKILPSAFIEGIIALLVVAGTITIKYGMGYDLKEVLPILGMFLVVSHRIGQNLSVLVKERMVIASFIPSLKLVFDLSRQGYEKAHSHSIDMAQNRNPDSSLGDIRLENVDFSYGQKTVFNGLDLTVPKGKMTALIGPSGYGKSTIADLLLRLYEPTRGRILIGERPLNGIGIEEWRSNIGFVSQDVFIFNTSVYENIALGKLDASREEVIAAANNAEAHEFIMELPEGYDTVIGERGLTLSGGQRQRLAIARAIIRDPEFLIFDEATSALDRETEKAIQKSIEKIGRNKTLLVIAHRLATIEHAEVVYDLGVLNKKQGISSKKVMVS